MLFNDTIYAIQCPRTFGIYIYIYIYIECYQNQIKRFCFLILHLIPEKA